LHRTRQRAIIAHASRGWAAQDRSPPVAANLRTPDRRPSAAVAAPPQTDSVDRSHGMTSRERFLAALSHKEGDRVPIHDSPWGHTINRWHREGLPEDQSPAQYFGWDELVGQGPDISFQFPHETLEETDTYTIYRDANGATKRSFKDHESTPELIDQTITDRRSWEENKARLAWNDKRVDWDNGLKSNREARERGAFVCLSAAIGYDRTQGFVRSDRLLLAIAEDPAWVKDMFDTTVDLVIAGAEEMMARGFEFDGAFMFDDLGYRNATLFSPAAFRELEFPSQKRLYDFCHAHKMPTILHSCGRVRAIVPDLLEAGLDCLQPLEVKSGMDLVELKKTFDGHLALFGGIDVRAMANPDPKVIEKEIKTKIPVAKKGGGYIYHSDHSVPSNVSFEQYARVMELVLECGTFKKARPKPTTTKVAQTQAAGRKAPTTPGKAKTTRGKAQTTGRKPKAQATRGKSQAKRPKTQAIRGKSQATRHRPKAQTTRSKAQTKRPKTQATRGKSQTTRRKPKTRTR
jgi:uroporphyrinogen decarboxylase